MTALGEAQIRKDRLMRVGEIRIIPTSLPPSLGRPAKDRHPPSGSKSKVSAQVHRGPYQSQLTPAAGRLCGPRWLPRGPPNPGSGPSWHQLAACLQTPSRFLQTQASGSPQRLPAPAAPGGPAAFRTPGPRPPPKPTPMAIGGSRDPRFWATVAIQASSPPLAGRLLSPGPCESRLAPWRRAPRTSQL